MRFNTFAVVMFSLAAFNAAACDVPEGGQRAGQAPAARVTLGVFADDWRHAESGILADHVQLTFSNRFVKAGESYFSPDDSKVIFQAVEIAERKGGEGEAPDDFYAMFVADVVRRPHSDQITGLTNIRRISPAGSANTCGWFHPHDHHIVIFSSTIVPPKRVQAPGFQGGANQRYEWAFPEEMKIVRVDLRTADGTADTLQVVGGYNGAYQAEGSISPNGRHLLYCSLESNEGDLFIYDLQTQRITRIVQAKGYDGGPFFSPDGKRICYRSDRLGDKMLQLFVAELAFNEQGEVVGIKREYQLTDDPWVNWCPFWTPDGRRLVYSSSELGERNFEIFLIDADPGDLPGSTGTIKYGTGKRRITYLEPADGGPPASDVLPAFSSDGTWMSWASRRSDDGSVQLWAARFVLDPDQAWKPEPAATPRTAQRSETTQITINDHDSGRVFIYDPVTHKLSEYHMATHRLTEITDPALQHRVAELYKAQQRNE